jgi:magnesium chelatase subunit D
MALITDPFMRSLAAAAITPGLRSILMFDGTPDTVRLAAVNIARMLSVVLGDDVVSVTLGTFESEDDLWGSWGLGIESEQQLLRWKQGLLTGGQNHTQ